MVPPCATNGHGRDVIDFVRLTGTSWAFDLASLMIALQDLEADLLPGSAVPRFPSHVEVRPMRQRRTRSR
jgi:hypothetical protein